MRKYEFRLANILEHRERLEEEAQQHLARIERRLAAEEATLHALELDFDELTGVLRTSHKTLSHDDLRMHYARADFLARSIRTREVTIMNVKMEQEAARTDLLNAAKDRRILETLKERREADHTAESVRLEHAHLDDANSRRSHFTLEHMKDHQ